MRPRKIRFLLHGNYSPERVAHVYASVMPSGYLFISDRSVKAATKRAGLPDGDWLVLPKLESGHPWFASANGYMGSYCPKS